MNKFLSDSRNCFYMDTTDPSSKEFGMKFSFRPPLTLDRQGRHKSSATQILFAFAAGLLLGVPVTFCALYVGSLGDVPLPTADDRDERRFSEMLHSHGNAQRIFLESGRPPVAHRLTNVRKSGLETRRIVQRRVKAIVSHASDAPADQIARRGILDFEDLVDGVFWSDISEASVPRGFVDGDVDQWREFLNATSVMHLEEGCGRMQNRLLVLSDGSNACARYRRNSDQIQGDIFSFYLARILGIQNLPPAALSLPDARSGQWSAVDRQMTAAGWIPHRPAVLTKFVDGLRPAFVPRQLREVKTRLLGPFREDLSNLTAGEVSELVQWSDLIVFDYLTANLDRVVNNMYNARWNPGMMSEPAHNLAITPAGLLLFLDNESGLLHGYRLLDKYEPLHRVLLDALCLFRSRTVRALEDIRREKNVEALLRKAFLEGDPDFQDWLPFLPDRNIQIMEERIDKILKQVQLCRVKFDPVPRNGSHAHRS